MSNRYSCLLASRHLFHIRLLLYVSILFYFAMTLYMFRTVFPSIIRSFRLYIQQQAYVKQIQLSASKQTAVSHTSVAVRINFILFWNDTLHVSDGLSVHHQEFKTVYTATGVCQTDNADCSLASSRQYLFGCCVYSLELLMMDGKTVRNI